MIHRFRVSKSSETLNSAKKKMGHSQPSRYLCFLHRYDKGQRTEQVIALAGYALTAKAFARFCYLSESVSVVERKNTSIWQLFNLDKARSMIMCAQHPGKIFGGRPAPVAGVKEIR